MRGCGVNAVASSFSESEMRHFRRAFEIQFDLARCCGLKVFVIPNRIGNRFAGEPLMSSLCLSQHPESQLPDHYGFAGPISCTQNPLFLDWIREFMETLIGEHPLDGIIWDEPKQLGVDLKTGKRMPLNNWKTVLSNSLRKLRTTAWPSTSMRTTMKTLKVYTPLHAD